MRKFRRLAGVIAAVALMAGCWEQPRFDAGNSNWNSGETAITSANADQLVELWDSKVLSEGWLRGLLSVSGKVYGLSGSLNLTSDLVGVNASSGARIWESELPPLEPPAELRDTVTAPVFFDNKVMVGVTDWALSFPSSSRFEFNASTGELLNDHGGGGEDLAIADGQLVTTNIEKVSSERDYLYRIAWDSREACTIADAAGRTDSAIVGDRIVWSYRTEALGYDSASTGSCAPQWQTDLGAEPRSVAAVGATQAAYVDVAGVVSVLDASSGAVLWRASVDARGQIAVAGDSIFVNTNDNQLVALPTDGCGADTCSPLWTASLPASVGTPVAGGDVVYVTSGGDIAAFATTGCGATTCEPLVTLDSTTELGTPIVDDGRVIAPSADGHLVAFGLRP